MKLKTASYARLILSAISVFLVITAMLTKIYIILIFALITILAASIIWFICGKCPHCGRYLGRFLNEHCPRCGGKLK